jgi:hypothetical protein
MQRYFTSFGFASAKSQERANEIACRDWLEDGWAQGGYKPMGRGEFEAAHPELNRIKGNQSGSRRR